MMHDALANLLSAIQQATKRNKQSIEAKPCSKVILNVLEILKTEGYIENFEKTDDRRGGIIKISFSGTINKIGAIKPRFAVRASEIEKFEKSFLPAKDFGRVILSTSKGMMTHIQAKEKKLGGRLIAYVY